MSINITEIDFRFQEIGLYDTHGAIVNFNLEDTILSYCNARGFPILNFVVGLYTE